MSQTQVAPRQIDAAGLADGTYGFVVVGGEVVSLGPASSEGGGGGGESYNGFVTGVLGISIGTSRLYNDSGSTRTITSVRASVGTAPVGADVVVDVNKNETSIFPTGTKPTIAAGTVTDKRVPDTTAWADGEYLTVDIDAVGSTVAGSNLTLQIEVV